MQYLEVFRSTHQLYAGVGFSVLTGVLALQRPRTTTFTLVPDIIIIIITIIIIIVIIIIIIYATT